MNPKFEAVKGEIEKATNIVIVVSARPNIDQMGGALALSLALSAMGKQTSVLSSQDPLVEVSNLVGIDKVKKTFQGQQSGDLTVSFPYKEGEIEKISYTLEGGSLNIIVKASTQGLTFEEKDVLFQRSGGGVPEVLLAIGVEKLSDLTPMFNLESLKDTRIINIDNNPQNQGFGDIVILDPNASSISEMIAELILDANLRMDVDSSQNILSGISFATQNFSSPKTSALAFEMAGIMMRSGAKRVKDKDRVTPSQNQIPSQNSNPNKNPFMPIPQQFNQNPRPQVQNQNPRNRGNIQRENQKENIDTTPPGDWLEPKIFKGSTNVS